MAVADVVVPVSHSLDMNSRGTNASTSVVSAATILGTSVPANYSQLNNEYIRRRYRRKYEYPEKSRELLTEVTQLVDNLKTAIEGQMEAAIAGTLQQITLSLDNGVLYGATGAGTGNTGTSGATPSAAAATATNSSASHCCGGGVDAGDRQRALCKAGVCPVLCQCLQKMGRHAEICARALHCIAFLVRHSDENKSSVCLENAKALGLHGICELIVGAVIFHKAEQHILRVACDAIRCLSALESNRERFGSALAPETLARALPKYSTSDPETICFLCRAIGHLAAPAALPVAYSGAVEPDRLRLAMVSAGVCENVVVCMQKHPQHLQVCTETCYAIRSLATSEAARRRLVDDFCVESILAVFKQHLACEAFAVEATRALTALTVEDCEEVLVKIASSGFISLACRAMKKSPQCEGLARWAFNLFFFIGGLNDKVTRMKVYLTVCTINRLPLSFTCRLLSFSIFVVDVYCR
jgi:hypothetical protein